MPTDYPKRPEVPARKALGMNGRSFTLDIHPEIWYMCTNKARKAPVRPIPEGAGEPLSSRGSRLVRSWAWVRKQEDQPTEGGARDALSTVMCLHRSSWSADQSGGTPRRLHARMVRVEAHPEPPDESLREAQYKSYLLPPLPPLSLSSSGIGSLFQYMTMRAPFRSFQSAALS